METGNLRQQISDYAKQVYAKQWDINALHYEHGQECMQKGKYIEAAFLFETVVDRQPHNHEARAMAREANIKAIDGLVRDGELVQARVNRDFALKFDPTLEKELAAYDLD